MEWSLFWTIVGQAAIVFILVVVALPILAFALNPFKTLRRDDSRTGWSSKGQEQW